MPIRINLLAEAQATEELRRKDPVKRALLIAGVIVTGVAAWSGSLQFSTIQAKRQLNGLEAKWKTLEKDYQAAVDVKRRSLDADTKLAALQQLTTNRFLWGSALNALQQSLAGLEDVQVVRLRTEQSYLNSEDNKGRGKKSDSKDRVTATEKVVITLEAIDSSTPPGSQVSRFKETLAAVPWFRSNLQKTNSVLLNSLSAPQASPFGKSSFVTFTLNCYFPEKVR